MHKAYDRGRAKARPFHFIRGVIVYGLALLLCLATLASFFGSWSWRLDLLAHFRPQLTLFGLLCIAVAILARVRTALALSLVATLVNAAPIAPYLFGQDGGIANASQVHVRVMTFNMQGKSSDQAALRILIEKENPDVVLLSEVPRSASVLLSGLESRFPYRIVEEKGIPLDITLLSRWRMSRSSVDREAAQFRSVLTIGLCDPDAGTHCFTLIGMHAAQPFAEEFIIQKRQIEIAVREAKAASSQPVVLLGDLNLTPWSRVFRGLLEDAALFDSGLVRGLTATWSSRSPLLGLPIDHVLVNGKFKVLDNRAGPDLGSDHFPVIADIAFDISGR
ncbi:endonuclease/exonuclease/phosphatase family protein [Microvirga sp. 2YAF29]|uniref:endonuclease/exonuclease/phosphatase family protein n=1 Tax=Microvirga sp. 2YAF29 TaxID=3233031 RepID=UPI003F96FB56